MKYVRRRFKPDDWRLIATMPHTMQVSNASGVFDFSTMCYIIPHSEVIEWCDEMFGKSFKPKTWAYGTHHRDKMIFYFTCKDHAMAFKLMWS